ncbi:MAG: Hsp20/alpha crystallin family protein [Oscillospiraceae bacterium]|jgi:HSP20 family protein
MYGLTPIDRGEKNPFRFLDRMEQSLWGNLADEFTRFRTDITEDEKEFTLQAELPGFEKTDIHLDAEEGYLTIRASHQMDQEQKDKNFIRRERRYGALSRSFSLDGIQADQITASYQNGILKVKLPKTAMEAKTPARKIEIQ